jgi:hypothetical protein
MLSTRALTLHGPAATQNHPSISHVSNSVWSALRQLPLYVVPTGATLARTSAHPLAMSATPVLPFEPAITPFKRYVLVSINKQVNSCYPPTALAIRPESPINPYLRKSVTPPDSIPSMLSKSRCHNFSGPKPRIHCFENDPGAAKPEAPPKFDTPNRRR